MQKRTLLVLTVGLCALAAPVLWAQQRGGGPPPPAQKGTGIILGQIVDGTTGRPVPDAVVTLATGRGLAAPARGVAPQINPPAITGSDGRFVFRDLPAGRVPINVTAAGYIESTPGATTPGGPARTLEITDGERISDLKIRLWKYAVVTGAIVDEAGEPAVGVQVSATRRPLPGQGAPFGESTTASTDDRGIYRISTLKPGDYYIVLPQTNSTIPAKIFDQVTNMLTGGPPPLDFIDLMSSGVVGVAPGMGTKIGDLLWSSSYTGAPAPTPEGRFQTYTTIFYPGVSSFTDAGVVMLRSGEERSGLDLQLRLVPTVRITGTVSGPKGPVANAGVRVVPAALKGVSSGAAVDTATGATRADGTFTIVGVPPGQYVASVVKRGGGESMMAMFTEALAGRGRGNQPPTLYAQASIAVGGADVTGVTLTLREGAKVSGRIDFDGASPRPSLEGAGGRGFTVRLMPASGGSYGAIDMQEPSPPDASGRFTTQAYPPGRYRLVTLGGVGGSSGSMWRVSSAMFDGHDILVEPFDLGEASIDDVVLTLSDRFGGLRGNVTVGATPARTATVVLVPADVAAWIASGMPTLRARLMPASRAGAYVMPDLKPGEYLVAALDDADVGELGDPRFAQAVARVATRVVIAPGENKPLDLQVTKVTR